MTKPFILGILIALLLSGCSHFHFHHKKIETPSTIPVGGRHIGPFTHVHVTGILDVTLHTDAVKPQVLLYGDPRDTAAVYWDVQDGVLHVNLGAGYPKYGPVRVDISSRYLTSFTYRGQGTIVGKNLHSNLLDLSIINQGKTLLEGRLVVRKLNVKGSGFMQINGINSRILDVKTAGKTRVQLVGVANLASLDMKGQSWLSLYWVRSKVLTVRAKGQSFIQLAGITNVLDVELWNKARFNGRFLRGKRSFVKTHDNSEADISVVKRQHTLATDASNIYYYNLPEMKADFMACNGSVLDMREWEQPFLVRHTRYNH